MTVFFYDKTKAEKGILFCLGQEDELEEKEGSFIGKNNLIYKNAVYHIGKLPLIGHPVVDGDIVRSANIKELVDLGLYILQDGEILVDGNIVTMEKPSNRHSWKNNSWVISDDSLNEGEILVYGEIKTIEPDCNIYNPVWNNDEKIWQESEESEMLYHKNINLIKKTVLYDGFIFVDHFFLRRHQSVDVEDRVDAYITSTNINKSNELITWYFNDGTSLIMNKFQFKKLNDSMCLFYETVLQVEHELKKSKPDKKVNIEFFKKKVEEVCGLGCVKKHDISAVV